MRIKLHVLFTVFICYSLFVSGQQKSASQISELIEDYKNDRRGPYNGIKWFCEDDSEREARDPCPDSIGGGIQHASFKKSALALRSSNHLFFGEILAGLAVEKFTDVGHNYSRLKQYQLGKYLASVDNGWVLEKAQYYRGAFQSEDEEAWGKDYFLQVLKSNKLLQNNYFLVRQALKDIPHNGENNLAQAMRIESKLIAAEVSSFMDIRIKIHGQPEVSDIQLVKDFFRKNESKLRDDDKKGISQLLQTMQAYYAPIDLSQMSQDMLDLTEENETTTQVKSFLTNFKSSNPPFILVEQISQLLYQIRTNINTFKESRNRLILLDISNKLEHTLLKEIHNWSPTTLDDILSKITSLACAAVGTGLIEEWEYDAIDKQISELTAKDSLSLADLNTILNYNRSIVEWSTSMVKANYQEDVNKYAAFEDLAYGFIDDRVRSSVALSLGETVSELGVFVSKVAQINNQVLDISNQTAIRGLNPGYACGELVVVDGNPDLIEVETTKIYIFEKPPSGLKPVAGILTVSEGNLVSHVQLLARNLGIPNAALSYDNLKALKKYNGQKVFYAVSSGGNVILKTEKDMLATELALFNAQERTKNVIEVPIENIRLDVSKVINMRDVSATDSGKLCGPKAANLGELKKMFPEQVVEGIIIPFGIS